MVGILKGSDALLNIVLDDTEEFIRGFDAELCAFPSYLVFDVDPKDNFKLLDKTRKLGLVVCRGTQLVLICPTDGMEEIANPFIQEADA